MVIPKEPLKTSDTRTTAQPMYPSTAIRGGIGYTARCSIDLWGHRPQKVQTADGVVRAELSGKDQLSKYPWFRPPHVALANLPTRDANGAVKMTPEPGLLLDEKAAEKFIRDYGFLHNKLPSDKPVFRTDWENVIATESIADIASAQKTLREAWSAQILLGGIPFLAETSILDTFQMHVADDGEIGLLTDDLWKFIEVLFVIDDKAGKLGVCANPNCLAPYFMRKRKTQRFCESGPCTAYAARQYTKRWWDTKGKKQRTKQQKKRRNKR